MGVSRIEGGEGAIERHFKKLDFLKKKKKECERGSKAWDSGGREGRRILYYYR